MLGLSQVAVKQLYDREVHQEEAAILSSLSHRRGLRSWLCACVCVGVHVWVRRRRCAQSACGRGTYTMRHRHHAEWAHDSMQKQRMMSFRGGARHQAEAQTTYRRGIVRAVVQERRWLSLRGRDADQVLARHGVDARRLAPRGHRLCMLCSLLVVTRR